MRGRVIPTVAGPRHVEGRCVSLFLLILTLGIPVPLRAQSSIPQDRIHLSVTLGGYFMVGVGYTHFLERHHAMEVTVFPLAWPREGLSVGLRAGYAWVPSDEVWRAKLGANATVLIGPGQTGRSRFTPILSFTPGIQYDQEHDRSFRTDMWISYYVRDKVLAPTALEFFFSWPK